MRRSCQPFLVPLSGSPTPLARLSLGDRSLSEDSLQALLHAAPDLLPISEIDPSFGPLISLGREVPSGVGLLDHLMISADGAITIVETKLWRNPQATREVVAQTLDYAWELSRWSYEGLEDAIRRCRNSLLKAGESLYQAVCRVAPGECLTEAEFADSVERTLRSGRFLLLVAGDGIRENVEGLLGALHSAPGLQFTFALVELQIFEHPAIGRLVVPQLIARTAEIVRAVVRVDQPPTGGATATITADFASETDSGRRKRGPKLNEEAYFGQLTPVLAPVIRHLVERGRDAGAEIDTGSSELLVRVPTALTGGKPVTLLVISPQGYVRGHQQAAIQLRNAGLPSDPIWPFFNEVAALFPGTQVRTDNPNAYALTLRPETAAAMSDPQLDGITASIRRVLEALAHTPASDAREAALEPA
jgi:hypothetical protein